MRKVIPNLAIIRPTRSMRDLPEGGRRYLLRQMRQYVINCELEDVRLRCLKERVNRP